MAASGMRVLALGYGQSIGELIFVGIVGMEDPPRRGVIESVRHLRSGGVKVLMVTGDSKETALAIAERCGIIGKIAVDESNSGVESSIDLESASSESLSGAEIDEIPPQSLADSIAGVKIFYRVVPRHKLALVRALQQKGEIVAMTGDGVNDSTALKGMYRALSRHEQGTMNNDIIIMSGCSHHSVVATGADIGIAMGKKGTDVAREAADVVLADDDFRTICMAISEGKG